MDEMFEIIKAGAPDGPPEQALYRIQQTYPDGSGGRLNVDWEGLLRLHDLIHDRIALEGRVCETCDTKGCHRPATWEIECRGVGVSGRLIYSCDDMTGTTYPGRLDALVEELAALEHEQWAHWTQYMLDNLSLDNIARWRRQCATPYADLTEEEKRSDREWAARALTIVTDQLGVVIDNK